MSSSREKRSLQPFTNDSHKGIASRNSFSRQTVAKICLFSNARLWQVRELCGVSFNLSGVVCWSSASGRGLPQSKTFGIPTLYLRRLRLGLRQCSDAFGGLLPVFNSAQPSAKYLIR